MGDKSCWEPISIIHERLSEGLGCPDYVVYDNKNKQLRYVGDVEAAIINYCFSHKHHYNEACARIGHKTFECELIHTDEIISAGDVIYDYLINHSGSKSKSTLCIVTTYPDYKKQFETNDK